MRIGGLASGLDTENMIRQLMRAERQPLDRFMQRKQTIEWQRDAYREMNTKLKTLEESAFSLRLTSAFNTRQVTSSNPSAFTVTSNSSARTGSYQFQVLEVASRTTNISEATISNGSSKVSPNTTMSLQTDAFGTDINNYHGESFTISTVNSEGIVENATFTVNTGESLNDLFKKINDSNLGIKAFYDSTFDKVVIERKTTGEFGNVPNTTNEILFSESRFLTDILKIKQENEVSGKDAHVKYTDPILGEIETTSKTNQLTIGSMTFNIMQRTATETVTVTSNTDQAFNNIKNFVDKYNETISIIQGKLNETKHRGFPPLTDEQRRELSDREAELWDEKARSGLLRRDPILTSTLNQMRTLLYTPVKNSGEFNHISQIGITTTSNFRDGGKLEIDENKLREALEQDPLAVHQLFNNVADKSLTDIPRDQRTAEQRAEIESQTGLVARIRTTISSEMDKILNRAGNTNRTNQQFVLGRELNDVDSQIDRFQRRLADIESRYWAQFSRMEKAANEANAQSMSLMQAFMNF
ncbi:flagellar hook-associated protein 2 [Bacillus alkalicellulosilyticus]|uniref:flagellar hook-associated protein 2 n=1 Tax=Alkalihalobacterium alkalicellulosilyticum TaxID=1912214 RepID=UPI000998C471|nr:flagellar hook-associated protein 2 [Bacillus alkalicellulosilyticus]